MPGCRWSSAMSGPWRRTVPRPARARSSGPRTSTDYVRAVELVLADLPRYRGRVRPAGLLDEWTWEAQAEVLDGVYARLAASRQAGPSSGVAGCDSVIVPLYNAMPYLTKSSWSLVESDHRARPAGGRRGRRRLHRRQRPPGWTRLPAASGHGQGDAPGNQLRRPGRAQQRGAVHGRGRYVFFIGCRRLPGAGGAATDGGRGRRVRLRRHGGEDGRGQQPLRARPTCSPRPARC